MTQKDSRKPGDNSSTNRMITALRKKGRSISVIAQELGLTKWYVRHACHQHLTVGEQKAAKALCKKLAGEAGAATQARRRKYRSMIGDIQYQAVSDQRSEHYGKKVRVPLSKSVGIFLPIELLHDLKAVADREKVKASSLLFPLINKRLGRAEEAIMCDIQALLLT